MIQNEDLKTPWRVRLMVGLIAVALLGSTLAIYLTVFVQYGSQPFDINTATTSELEDRYEELSKTVATYTSEFSAKYYEEFLGYKASVKGYNEAALTELDARDLKVGDGEEIDSASQPYLAYYVGWEPDESVIDSSFDNPTCESETDVANCRFNNPTGLRAPLSGSTSMIEGWLLGIVGMRVGGVREISIPSDYAYGNGPLKFIIMLIPYEEHQLADITEMNEVGQALVNSQYN